MAKKNRPRLSLTFFKILLIIPVIFSLTARLFTLAQQEIRSLRKKIIVLLVLSAVSIILLLSIWVYGNILLILYLLSVQLSLMISISVMMGLNVLLLIIVCLIIALIKLDLSLSETRKMIQSLLTTE